jgi:hypothetical protein
LNFLKKRHAPLTQVSTWRSFGSFEDAELRPAAIEARFPKKMRSSCPWEAKLKYSFVAIGGFMLAMLAAPAFAQTTRLVTEEMMVKTGGRK